MHSLQVLKSFGSHSSPARGTLKKTKLDEVGFVDIFNGRFFFGERGAERVEANGAAAEFFYKDGQERTVGGVETEFVNAEEL